MDKKRGLKNNSEHLGLNTGRIDLALTEAGKNAGVQNISFSLGESPGDPERCLRFEITFTQPREVLTGQRNIQNWEEVQAGNINLEIISMYMAFKFKKLNVVFED